MFRHELPSANTRNDKLARGRLTMSTGENLLHILNTLESRAAVLEAELREIDEDIALNANMARKYGDEFFTEGSARLMQTRVDKQQRLAEISTQLQQTGQSVQQGKQLLGSLMDNYGHPVPACPPPARLARPTLWRAHVRCARRWRRRRV
jgi:transcription initiation factor TFIID subunit TAF12